MIGLKHDQRERKTAIAKAKGSQILMLFLGFVFVILVAAFGGNLVKNFNTSTGQLNLFGKILQLTENEEGDKADNNEVNDSTENKIPNNKENTTDNKSMTMLTTKQLVVITTR